MISLPRCHKLARWIMLVMAAWSAVCPGTGPARGAPSDPRPLTSYQVQPGDTLSAILFRFGIGGPSSSERIYGRGGWIEKVRAANPEIADWRRLPAGTKLYVPLPVESAPVSARAAFDPVPPAAALPRTVVREIHHLQAGETLSGLLLARGVGKPGARDRLFGSKGWLRRVQSLNPQITDWGSVAVGTALILEWPVPTTAAAIDSMAAAPTGSMQTAPEHIAEGAAPPGDIDNRAPSGAAAIDPAALASTLDEQRVAGMDDAELAKIPEEAVATKAWDVSVFDADQPGMERLFKRLKVKVPGGYLGIRGGYSLVNPRPDTLGSLQMYSALAEIRSGSLAGLRLVYDVVPELRGRDNGVANSVAWTKLMLGWAFSYKPPAMVDHVHLIPRIGRYSLHTSVPVAFDAQGSPIMRDLDLSGAMALGLEVDAELAAFFYVFRLWAAQDIVSPALGAIQSHSVKTIRATRAGIDGYLKGPGFSMLGRQLSLSYLVFASYEFLTINTRDDALGNPEVKLELPVAGLGTSIAW